MHFDVFECAILGRIPVSLRSHHKGSRGTGGYLFRELVGMSTVRIDTTERRRSSSIAEKVDKLMDALRVTSMEAMRGLLVSTAYAKFSILYTYSQNFVKLACAC